MWLEVTGTSRRLDRPVVTATCIPRKPGPGGSALKAEFDLEHGTPLYIQSLDETGDQVTVTEILRLDYNPVLETGTFDFSVSDASRGATVSAAALSRTRVEPAHSRTVGVPSVRLAADQTIWLTGLPGAGKTTIAQATERLIHQLGGQCCILDGDRLRQGLSRDLGLSRIDRAEQTRRVANVAATLADAGVIPIVALVSPYAKDRREARVIQRAAGVGFIEVWVDTPTEVCAARDPKGLYAAASLSRELVAPPDDGSGLTGVSAPYEPPEDPELRVRGDCEHPRAAATRIVEALLSRDSVTDVLIPPTPTMSGLALTPETRT
jgi:bifunctional enzyme CysN/CysC